MKTATNFFFRVNTRKRNALIILAGFLLYYVLLKQYVFSIHALVFLKPGYIRAFCFQLICLTPLVVVLLLIYRPTDVFRRIGLNGNFITGIGVALFCTLPMIIGNMIIGTIRTDLSLNIIIGNVIYSGFFEELAFRGFLFGLLFRYTKWGFVPAAMIGSMFFGIAHIYQGHDAVSALAAFGVTALGAAFFSWTYVEWNYNLWIPIGLHTFMNASWIFISVSNGAVGDGWSNLFRVLTIVATIVATISYKKKNKLSFLVNRRTLWINE